ncbi:cellulase family glycosylhydrolase [Nocardia jiangxiensis]|uniref:Cellulase family glycosylhydrolase n=1 Tax=Nocardia jiangxiensis TaxID=282685 RepID=A0ABW6SAT6_9NOCA|nr:cellulase family glycosylhydrolase [Nocardia jiangxiensis]
MRVHDFRPGRCRDASTRTGLRRPWVVALLLMVLAVAAVPPSASAQSPRPPARAGKWLVDDQGRVISVHGVNLVRKTAPYYPANFGEQDAALLASEGFDAARIGFIWEAVEPRPGVYDDAYIRRIVALNDLLAAHGIRTLVDFHQDGWSRSAGISQLGNSSGDGAPQWATLGADPRNAQDDFQAFWDDKAAADGIGIQTHFVHAWQHVIRMLNAGSGRANIVGLDPFNEPYAGSGYSCEPFLASCPAFEQGALAQFYGRVITALRGTGDTHVIFPESDPNTDGSTALPALPDSAVGHNFHAYCFPVLGAGIIGAPTPPGFDVVCPPQENQAVAVNAARVDRTAEPGFLSEFGASDVNTDNARLVDLADEHFWSWAYWAYYVYHPQDPANSDTQGLLVDESKPASQANAKQAKLDALAVPWARAIAGTPSKYHFDRATSTMTLTYSTAAAAGTHLTSGARTEIFLPTRHYPRGYDVRVNGGTVVSAPGAQLVQIAATSGAAHDVSATVTRR